MADWQHQGEQQGWAGAPQPSAPGPWGAPQHSQYADPSWNAQMQQPWAQQQQPWAGGPQASSWNAGNNQPFAQPQPQPHFQQPAVQQHAAQPHAQIWPPNLPAMDLGDPMLNVAFKGGAHLVQVEAEKAAKQYMPGVTSFWGSMRKYFQVNNSFVLKKLNTILFPFIKKDWERTPTMEPPASDPNSPDLYIPLMALSTYVLTVGLAKGSSMNFNPEVIVDTFGTSVMVLIVQVALIRVAQMTLVPWVTSLPWLELLAYTGYLFTGVAINMLVGLLFGTFLYNLSLLWTATCAAFGIYQTMRAVVPPPEPGQRGKRRRVNFFIMVAVLQVFVMWFLGYTRELRSAGVFSIARGAGESLVSPVANKGGASPLSPPVKPEVMVPDPKLAEMQEQILGKPESQRAAPESDRDFQQQRAGGKRGRRNQQAANGDATDV